jgi:cell wall-associated NlpC family hydrolase
MRARVFWFVSLLAVVAVGALGGLARSAAPAAAPTKVFDNGNVAAVQNGATVPTIFTTTKPWKIVQIYTYHWNDAKGATPGLIGLADLTTNKKYGPWRASGLPGQGGVPNAYWVVAPKIEIPAGRYQITDSNPGTWSQNSGTGGAGMVMVYGLPTSTTTTPHPSAAKVRAAVAWAQAQVGSPMLAGKCERFVEAAYGARTGYANAAVAARRIGLRNGPVASVPRGALIYFRPNSPGATGKAGHVGISLGGGKMISALGVVKITDLNKRSPLATAYSGWAYPPTTWPGRTP